MNIIKIEKKKLDFSSDRLLSYILPNKKIFKLNTKIPNSKYEFHAHNLQSLFPKGIKNIFNFSINKTATFTELYEEPIIECNEKREVINDFQKNIIIREWDVFLNQEKMETNNTNLKKGPEDGISLTLSKNVNLLIKINKGFSFFTESSTDREFLKPLKNGKNAFPKKQELFTINKNVIDNINLRHCKRKNMPDEIRKKIKSRFHKIFKDKLNHNLKMAGSQKLFDHLPQIFINDISKKNNKEYLKLTYKELLEKDFTENYPDLSEKEINTITYKRQINKEVLDYLKHNPVISEKSGFKILSSLTYEEVLREFFDSEEFKNSIKKLCIEDKEDENYIHDYIEYAKSYIKYFKND